MNRTRLRRVLRDLTGRTNREFVALLLAHVDNALTGIDLARAAADGAIATEDARTRINDVEHAGDAARQRLIVLLRHTIVSPIDREDMFRLSRSVDDILDTLRDFVREMDLLGAEAEPLLAELLTALTAGMHSLRKAISALAERPLLASKGAMAAKKNAGRREYQFALATVLTGDISRHTLTQLELLRRLDIVGLRLTDAANALSDGLIKRYQ